MAMTARPAPIGQRFGRLVVIIELPSPASSPQRPRLMECACDCGGTKITNLRNLKRGFTLSCGCLYREGRAGQSVRIHGLWNHPLYHTWTGMLHRCEDPGATGYKNYGGRGIKVCPEWHDVTAFVTWIETNLGPRPDGMTLDRRDNSGDYEPGNVRWADWKSQAGNKRPTEYEITCPCGQTFTAADSRARYCSKACRENAHNARKRRQPAEFTCPCGTTFTSTWPRARYCSKSCSQRAENEQRRRKPRL